MSNPIDFDGINQAALSEARSLLQDLLPGGKFSSSQYVVKNPNRDDGKAGSFTINHEKGVWKDFATGDGGGDLISLAAYIWGCGQSVAALRLAEKLGVPAASKPTQGASRTAPKIRPWGDEGPPVRDDEIRRHVYRNLSGTPVKIKIKYRDGKFANFYRHFRDGKPGGWQARKPAKFEDVPYVTGSLNPFDIELQGDQILWPEGEKDVDTLSKLSLPAFTFGGVGDGLPAGIEHYLTDRRVVILADNDDAGRKHTEKKAEYALWANAASIQIVHFLELPVKADVSDYIAHGGTRDALLSRIDASPVLQRPIESKEQGSAESRTTSGLLVRRASTLSQFGGYGPTELPSESYS
jgi:putative DNA primase/helicase